MTLLFYMKLQHKHNAVRLHISNMRSKILPWDVNIVHLDIQNLFKNYKVIARIACPPFPV